ncbi:MAG: outer membrane lipoprotein carrier protein LolA [Gammaproteobacteria bacterium]|nr:outer membrane lipoprotein carrier protein LolA [Gammaproteobacteria bacterium]
MNNLKSVMVFIAAVVFSTSVVALQPALITSSNQAAFTAVQTQLSQADHLKGNFKQVRHIQLLSSPLVSSGQFELSKTQGLSWHQTQPFVSDLTVSQDKIEQTFANNPPTIITEKEQPVVFSFTKIFLAVFNGDLAQVAQNFTILFAGDTKAWTIVLTPKVAPLNKAIESVMLTGGKTIATITIKDVQKDEIDIALLQVETLK